MTTNEPMITALNLLSKRDATEAEIRNLLIEKLYTHEQIEATITRLYELKMLDDKASAQAIARSYQSKGNNWLRKKMVKKGIQKDDISVGLRPQDEEMELATKVAENKIRHIKGKDKHEKYNKLARFLYTRGFAESVCWEVARQVCSSLD